MYVGSRTIFNRQLHEQDEKKGQQDLSVVLKTPTGPTTQVLRPMSSENTLRTRWELYLLHWCYEDLWFSLRSLETCEACWVVSFGYKFSVLQAMVPEAYPLSLVLPGPGDLQEASCHSVILNVFIFFITERNHRSFSMFLIEPPWVSSLSPFMRRNTLCSIYSIRKMTNHSFPKLSFIFHWLLNRFVISVLRNYVKLPI